MTMERVKRRLEQETGRRTGEGEEKKESPLAATPRGLCAISSAVVVVVIIMGSMVVLFSSLLEMCVRERERERERC